MPRPSVLTEEHRDIILDLVEEGLTNQQIQDILLNDHQTPCSLSTITRARCNWGLQARYNVDTQEFIKELVALYHGKGLRPQQIIDMLKERHTLVISERTLSRLCKTLDLHRRKDDVDRGIVTLDQVADFIRTSKRRPDGKLAGYRRVQNILRQQNHVHVHRNVVAEMVKQMDADGVDTRLRESIHRRTFYVPGPNHSWSADGHDKLKKFGITIYGIIDAWSRRVLGLFVHITNNNPAHIGLYYLEVVKSVGGIPQHTVTDHGTETIYLAAHQIGLIAQFGDVTIEEAIDRHRFTTSPHNQKIECLWSQLMRQHNKALIDMIFNAMEMGQYNEDDPLQKLLFLHLWVPLTQCSLNQWMDDYNSYSKRFDGRTMLPTNCSPDVCYYAPVANNGVEGLIPVPSAVVDNLRREKYPNADELMMTSPEWLSEFVTAAQAELLIDPTKIDMDNVWPIFHQILALMQAYDQTLLGTAPGVPRPPTNYEQAKVSVENRFGRVPHQN